MLGARVIFADDGLKGVRVAVKVGVERFIAGVGVAVVLHAVRIKSNRKAEIRIFIKEIITCSHNPEHGTPVMQKSSVFIDFPKKFVKIRLIRNIRVPSCRV